MTDLTRRNALAVGVTGAAAALAGCLSEVPIDGATEDTNESADGDGSLGDPADDVDVTIVSMPNPAFEPNVVHVEPGATVRWILEGNRHTVTAYHPDTHGPQRIPDGVEPWESGTLSSTADFEWTFEEVGIYDYVDTRTLCATHEALGAVGRVVVGWPELEGQPAVKHDAAELDGRATTVMREIDEETRAVLEER